MIFFKQKLTKLLEETDGNIKLTPSYHGRGLSGVKEMLMGDVIHIFSGIEVCQFLGSLKVFPIICRALALKKLLNFIKLVVLFMMK